MKVPARAAPHLMLVAAAMTLIGGASRAHGADSTIVGGGLAFGSDITQPGLNLCLFRELAGSPVRVGGQLTTYFPNASDEQGFDQTDFLTSLDLGAQWTFFNRDRAFIYATGALHLDYVRQSFDFDDLSRESEAENTLGAGISFGAGVDVDIDFAGIYGESNIVVSTSGFSQARFTAGLRFWLN